ncbi:EAL domain-containing protein [Brevibacillus fluminis]|uniref:EAL domain-containing protein n=1 Tax=Brevibacillus fluminis TaxID=511487 RepID=UPI003F899331
MMEEHLHGTYNWLLITLSYVIAVTASYSALDLAGRISTSAGRERLLWLICGALSMGIGIWSMHFVGMLAFSLPLRISYDSKMVIVSVLLAICVSFIALIVVGRNELKRMQLIIGGLLMAAGIVGMHYVGMAAMSVDIHYKPVLVGLSVAIAATASLAALWLLFYFRKDQARHVALSKLISGMIMGAAIAGMHYTGMAAAEFQPSTGAELTAQNGIKPGILAVIIAASTLFMLGLTMLGVVINKRLSQKDLVIRENARWYRSLYENNEDGIISIDTKGRILSFNPAMSRITGLQKKAYVGQHISRIGLDQVMAGETMPEDTPSRRETSILHQNGDPLALAVTQIPVRIDGKVAGYHIIAKDITEEKRIKESIQHLAYHDELTGLPNRRKFNSLIEEAIEQNRKQRAPFAVMVVDIDRFKMINDSLGHAYGDLFLQMVSERMQASMKDHQAILARMGGDEFTFLCFHDEVERDAAVLAKRIIASIQVPYHLKDNDFYVTASIGIAIYPEHGTDAGELLKNADTAMYEVKKRGKNDYEFYSDELDVFLREKIELEDDLRKAIERNQLHIHYQPQISTVHNRITGVEALVRWNHPTKGEIQPGVFIPIAEEAGIIFEIGSWVLREACSQMRKWHDAGGPLIPVSVNLSSQQFHHLNLPKYIRQILEETGLKPEYLNLEITESMMMDATVSTTILQELAEYGVRFSLDDFGTGYSSLGYLRKFPIHKLKIDRSFITDITMNKHDQAIVATIISMANHLQLDVIAEGIETQDQLDILMSNDCKEIQGYYFSRPLPAAEVEELLFAHAKTEQTS